MEFVGPQGLPFKERDLVAFLGEILFWDVGQEILNLRKTSKREAVKIKGSGIKSSIRQHCRQEKGRQFESIRQSSREQNCVQSTGWAESVRTRPSPGRGWRLQDVLCRPTGVHLEPEGTFQIPSDRGDGKKSRPILEWKINADSSGTTWLPHGD